MRRDDVIFGSIIITVFLLAGFGVAKLLEYVSFGGNEWPGVFLTVFFAGLWFSYQMQTDGFSLRQAKNNQKVYEYRERLRTIEAAKQIQETKHHKGGK